MGWEKHQVALKNFISPVTKPPVLTYPDFSKDFTLHVDASKGGLGYALNQQKQDQLRVIGYGSRTLASTEKRYHLSKLEHLALKWVVCDHFKPYVYYAKDCDVSSDNNPLLYSVSAAKLNTID